MRNICSPSSRVGRGLSHTMPDMLSLTHPWPQGGAFRQRAYQALQLLSMVIALTVSFAVLASHAPATDPPANASAAQRTHALAPLSGPAAELLSWIARTGNNESRPYVVVDKQKARVWVFDAQNRPLASTPALLGLTLGDHEVTDIRTRNVATLSRDARITPAGRFVTEPGVNLQGEDVIWMDYDAGLAMHRVRPGLAQVSRLKRLANAVASEQRVSMGCVVLPVAFYEGVIRPLLGRQAGVVYVLPEHSALQAWLTRWDRAVQSARASEERLTSKVAAGPLL